jgi:hypothetical protein
MFPNWVAAGLAICEDQSFPTKFVRAIMVRGMRGSEIILRSPFPIPLTIIPLTPLLFFVFHAHHRFGCDSAALGLCSANSENSSFSAKLLPRKNAKNA